MINTLYHIELLIEASQTTDHITSSDALVYCVGALKFLSGNTTVLKHLVKLNCIDAMANLLKAINKTVRYIIPKHNVEQNREP